MESWNLNFKNWGLRRARRLFSPPAKESHWEMDVVWVHGCTQFGFQPGNGSLRMGVVFKWVLMCAYAMSGLYFKKTSCWRNGVRLLQVAEIGEGREAWEEGWRTHTKALKKQASQHRSCRLQRKDSESAEERDAASEEGGDAASEEGGDAASEEGGETEDKVNIVIATCTRLIVIIFIAKYKLLSHCVTLSSHKLLSMVSEVCPP